MPLIYLLIKLGKSEEQEHALLVLRVAPGRTGLKFLEQKVKLLFVKGLSQLNQHVEHIYLHCFERVRLQQKSISACAAAAASADMS